MSNDFLLYLPLGLIGALKTVLIIKRMAKTFIVDFDDVELYLCDNV